MAQETMVPKEGAIANSSEFKDAAWATKIRIAKEARSSAIAARRGKRATFIDRQFVGSPRRT